MAVLADTQPDEDSAQGTTAADMCVSFLRTCYTRELEDLLLEPAAEALYGLPASLLQRGALATASGVGQIKQRVRVRLTSLPQFLDAAQPGMLPSIGSIRCAHAEKLVTVAGTVVRSGAMQMLEARRIYECGRCRHRFYIEADLEMRAMLPVPQACPNQRGCRGTSFLPVDGMQTLTDYQEVRVQERMQCLAMGAMPRSVTVILIGELADRCRPGDDVEVTGVIHAARPLVGRNIIVASMCPQIRGLAAVKLATLLMLIGGLERKDEGGMHIRGEIHMLLVGDPGTGKSQFMKYAARLSPRAVVTTGRSSSGAGLTVAAVREGGQWVLEAGALVLADRGLCCIDEFNGLRDAERVTVHEAMEQQSISVAKAGLITRLSTRASMFGVCNPKGSYDARESLSVNTGLAAPLLSRFDLLLVLRDTHDAVWDGDVCDHILSGQQASCSTGSICVSQAWPLEALRQYIAWVKQTFQPAMSAEAEEVLLGYWRLLRGAADRQASRTTVRMLESLVRMAQAHARLMARQVVARQDAILAVVLAEESMQTSAAEIKRAFRLLCLRWHPDLCPPAQRQEAEQAFRNIAEAYAALSGRTPIRDWQTARARSGAGASAARLPKRYSNLVIALMITVPMVMTGVFVGR
ncbi:hypothetical protein WJX81_002412 [Elliptochloris bilobata]|uniref:DNA helicase n=1 Tax=Elliptochloris bilobata TaxID=381761 RepID=A0AAW1QIQ9_9CHLO